MSELDSPHLIAARLLEVEQDLAVRQNALGSAASAWVHAKREKERSRALALMAHRTTGASVSESTAVADSKVAVDGVTEEAEYTALRAVVQVLESRASVLQSLLKLAQI